MSVRNIFTGMAAVLMSAALLFAAPAGKNSERIVLTSFYPMYIMTLNVMDGVPGTKVVNMTKPQTGCLHDYQLTPQDLKTLSSAWVFVVNGAGMESFIDKAVKQQPSLRIITASDGIELIGIHEEGHDGHSGHDTQKHQEAHDAEHEHGDNPHVWVSVSAAVVQVKNIAKGLAAADSENAAKIMANADAYCVKLETLRKKMHGGLSGVTSRDIITFHEAFPYFAKEFNLSIAAVIEREPGSEPSAGELAETIKIIKSRKVKALFAEPQYAPKAAETIARETGLKVYTLDPAVTGPLTPDAYIRIMESNLAVLLTALK